MKYRLGRRVLQHIYRQAGPEPDDALDEPLVTFPTLHEAHWAAVGLNLGADLGMRPVRRLATWVTATSQAVPRESQADGPRSWLPPGAFNSLPVPPGTIVVLLAMAPSLFPPEATDAG